jgi:hypothetical protein
MKEALAVIFTRRMEGHSAEDIAIDPGRIMDCAEHGVPLSPPTLNRSDVTGLYDPLAGEIIMLPARRNLRSICRRQIMV